MTGFLAGFLLGLTAAQLFLQKALTFKGWFKKQENPTQYWVLTLIYCTGGVAATFYVIYT